MKNKRLTMRIKGREALPVRAIPYVTGWMLSPHEVAGHLSRTIEPAFAQLKNVSAYHQHAGASVRVLPKEWDAVVTQLAAFERELRAKFRDYDRGYAPWRDKAVSVLPAGVFVWLNEFKREFGKDVSPERVTYTNERPGERDLIFTPMLPEGVRETVLEGFTIEAERHPDESEAQDIKANENAGVEAEFATRSDESEGQDVEVKQNADAEIAALFDPIGTAQLETMFPADGNWQSWCERSKRNGLAVAKAGRARFNPYLASKWWLDKQNPNGWAWARCVRVLANHLPVRSKDSKYLLTGVID